MLKFLMKCTLPEKSFASRHYRRRRIVLMDRWIVVTNIQNMVYYCTHNFLPGKIKLLKSQKLITSNSFSENVFHEIKLVN